MPNVRKLSHEEVRTIERKTLGQRRAVEVEYDAFLRDFGPGDYGEAVLEPNEKRLTVRNRLKAAAARHVPPLQLFFPRTRDSEIVRFKVAAVDGAAPAAEAAPEPTPEPVLEVRPVSTDEPPAPAKRGRPRKVAEPAAETSAPKRTRKPRSA